MMGNQRGQQEIVRALIAENKKLTEGKMKGNLERRKEVKELQEEIKALKEGNQKPQDEKL